MDVSKVMTTVMHDIVMPLVPDGSGVKYAA